MLCAAVAPQQVLHRLIGADLEHLDEGTPVSYVEEQGDEGPQASQVRVGKHHGDVL